MTPNYPHAVLSVTSINLTMSIDIPQRTRAAAAHDPYPQHFRQTPRGNTLDMEISIRFLIAPKLYKWSTPVVAAALYKENLSRCRFLVSLSSLANWLIKWGGN